MVADALRETGESTVYVELNAIAPATGWEIAGIIRGAGGRYVDGSIIGGPPRPGRSTKFYASGPDVKAFQKLSEYGLDVRPLGPEVGQGKGIKMVYAALTKGLTAISTQLLMAAWEMGLYDTLEALHAETQGMQQERMRHAVPIMTNKSPRWVSEMEEIAKTYEALGITGKMYEGAAEFYRFVGGTPLAEEKAETMDRSRTLRQVIEVLCDGLE
jgi:3-hydroxyisobutyrate dehydrogenase-like beta-hydroxyacid dehydrogenase